MLLDGPWSEDQMTRRLTSLFTFTLVCFPAMAVAVAPSLSLGPKPSFGLFQPRVTVEISSEAGGTTFGPEASTFVLDTAANGVLIFPPATDQLVGNGFANEGTYEESGLSGKSTFEVSAPYHLSYAGSDGVSQQIDDVRFMSGASAVDPTGLMGLNGIVGVGGMTGKVTTLDNRTREGAPSLSMGVSFSTEIPESSTQRFTVPFHKTTFEVEGDQEPFPFWSADLPSVTLHSAKGDKTSTDSLIFDTGAQLTIISEAMANKLQLDANQNGDFTDEAVATAPISGATGTINAPVLVVDRFSLPTDQGVELTWTDAEVIVLDIDPRITGVLASDFITDDGGLSLSLLDGGSGGLGDLLGGGDLGDLLGGGGGLGDLLGGGAGGLGDLLGGGGLGGLDGLLGGGLGGLDGLLGGGLDGLLGGGGLDDLLGGGGGLGGLGGLLGGGGLDDLFGGTGGLDDLLGGGLGGLGGSDLFAAFPLDSNFDRVHIDLRDFETGGGQLVLDLKSEIGEALLNGDQVLDAADIDDLTAAIDSDDLRYDLNGDGSVDLSDREMLVSDVFGTLPGDADLDKNIDFGDFLVVSNNFDTTTGWSGGDFDGNGKTDFADFLLLSANFGATAATAQIPEPSTGFLCLICLGVLARFRRGRMTGQLQ